MTDTQPANATSRRRPPRSWWIFAGAGVLAGLVVGLVIPPPYPDGQWWGRFLTSAGFGGSLAVVGASIAAR